MKIDPRELQELAATAAPRLDMYTGIHKAIRALMADTLLAVGRMDADDELEFAQVTQRVVELLDFCRSHLSHENEFVHPAIEARAPGVAQRIAAEHVDHEHHIDALARSVEALRALPKGGRDAAALALYRALSTFVAENFEHMVVEETTHNAALWAHYSDPELGAIHGALLASIPPAEMMFSARWIVPFMNPRERAALVQEMRWNAPAPAFEALLAVVKPHLTQREWDKLANAIGL